MPHCERCDHEWLATTRGPMEECPGCGSAVAVAAEERPVPWHFKLLVVATVLYLGWRAVQGVVWLVQRL